MNNIDKTSTTKSKTPPKNRGRPSKNSKNIIGLDEYPDKNNDESFIEYLDEGKDVQTAKPKNARQPKEKDKDNDTPKTKKNKSTNNTPKSKKELSMNYIATDTNFVNSGNKLFNSRTINLTNTLSQSQHNEQNVQNTNSTNL
jgi:hypothetical protein